MRSSNTRRRTLTNTARLLVVAILSTLIAAVMSPGSANASTSGFKGVNWADSRDNFVNGVLYVSGLSSSDTYASAQTVGNQVVGQLDSITGANTVRMPINEPTVSSYWTTYTGAIDAALSKGNVILSYWAWENGKPDSVSTFDSMWDTVIAKYGSNANAYFEVINEPYGYSTTDLDNLYNSWLTRYPSLNRGHVILDGTGYAQNAANVGSDSRLNNTLIGIHDYSFFVSPAYNDENDWSNHLAGFIGSYASRTIVTEWGGPMSTGTKDSISYNPINYDIPSGSFFADYLRGEATELRTLGVGSVLWPGLRDGDWYSLTTKTGSGASIHLTLANQSGLDRLQYAWGGGNAGGTYVTFADRATGLAMSSLGRTTVGSNVGQATASRTDTNQEWIIVNDGSYVQIYNRGTGLYLDGMGRTTNSSAVGMYTNTNSTNQQWTSLSDGNYVQFKNRATGMIIDGLGRASGSDVGQYSNSNSNNQQWMIAAGS